MQAKCKRGSERVDNEGNVQQPFSALGDVNNMKYITFTLLEHRGHLPSRSPATDGHQAVPAGPEESLSLHSCVALAVDSGR